MLYLNCKIYSTGGFDIFINNYCAILIVNTQPLKAQTVIAVEGKETVTNASKGMIPNAG